MYTRQFLIAILLLFCLADSAFLLGQTKGFSVGSDPGKVLEQGTKSTPDISSALKNGAFPTDNVVSAEYYHVGPGDVLLLQEVGIISGEYPLMVSAENTVFIPRVGEIDLKKKTLAEARKMIQDSVTAHNAATRTFVSLQSARTVYVNISGNIAVPGVYTLPASMSVSTAVNIANQLLATETKSLNDPLLQKSRIRHQDEALISSSLKGKYIGSYASRNTLLLHKDGTTEIADAVRAQVMGDPTADPMLREGDQIFVPFETEATPTISITGAVHRPSIVSYRRGDKASFLLKLGYGLTELGDSTQIYLFDPQSSVRTLLNPARVLSGEEDRELVPGSNIVVEGKSTVAPNKGIVVVSGHVQLPGSYLIDNNTTRLRDVINQAGGFASDAYLPLAQIIRRDVLSPTDENTDVQMYRNLQYSSLSLSDSGRYKIDMYLRRPVVSCDFAAAFERNSDEDNVRLQDGDVIVVPSDPHNVFVYGQVNKPGYVSFEPGKTMEWYIERAGGYAKEAEMGRTRIIRGRTKVWVEGDNTVVQSGDEVYIPRPTELPPGVKEQTYSVYATVAAVVISLAGLLFNIFRK